MNITYAFLYKWIEISTGKWYIGSRTKANCHPADGYLCSSRTVAPLIRINPTNWTRQIAQKIAKIKAPIKTLLFNCYLRTSLN